jgi:hypothetical protein
LPGRQVHATESIVHASSPQAAAEARVPWLPPSAIESFAEAGCEARRVRDSGAHTTRHDTAQSTGIVHALWIVNATWASPASVCAKLVQSESERRLRSADAGTPVAGMTIADTTIDGTRAHVAHRTQHTVRMTDLRDGARAWLGVDRARGPAAPARRSTRHALRGAAAPSMFKPYDSDAAPRFRIFRRPGA